MTNKECLKHLMEEMALSQAKAQIIMGMPSKDKMEINKLCYQQVLNELEVLDQLEELLSMDYLVRVYGYEMAKRLQTYLKSNDIVKEWLEKR